MFPWPGLRSWPPPELSFCFARSPKTRDELERERRAYLNRVGRIVEGQILEVVDHKSSPPDVKPAASSPISLRNRQAPRPSAQRQSPNGTQKLLYYTYSISGVTYETAQDVTGFEEQAHLKRIAVGQTASVKYDPSNPSNSILLADDWSGIH